MDRDEGRYGGKKWRKETVEREGGKRGKEGEIDDKRGKR